ncbi:RNA methyltransferase [Pelagibacterales bacterium SAG-MED15]|nr:RNA methyltransferase [Pelagibacterales bacterium SAG-MED15]
MFNNITFILNKPQLSENIGACARAIKNFNFSKLVLINPKPSFPNDKIIATSVGAKEIIKKAKNYSDLKPALNNIDYLISTTSRFRNKNIKHIELKDLKKIDLTKKIAFLFGAEASGLSNKDISYSNYVLKIPCNPDFKSLNLSHSLIIVAHSIFDLLNQNNTKYKKSDKIEQASKKDIKSMVDLCINHLDEINFFKPSEKKPKMMQNLLSLFYRVDLSRKETRILSSVFASLAKKGRLTK